MLIRISFSSTGHCFKTSQQTKTRKSTVERGGGGGEVLISMDGLELDVLFVRRQWQIWGGGGASSLFCVKEKKITEARKPDRESIKKNRHPFHP